MSDYSELTRLAQRVIDLEVADGDAPIGEAWGEFEAVATPSVVLSLIAENERLKSDLHESNDLVEHLGDKRKALTAERDQLKAKNGLLNDLVKRSYKFVAFAFDQGLEGAEDVGRDMDLALGKEVRS